MAAPAPAPTIAQPAATAAAPPAPTAAPQQRAKVTETPVPKAAERAAKPAATAKAAPARPPAATTRTATAARKPVAEELCSNRTQFSYLYCMRDACARPANRNNSQCAALRRSGDLR
jgi:hypothetical protein